MKSIKAVAFVCFLALTGSILTPAAFAEDWNKKTVVTFSAPVEIPGVHLAGWGVLPAGTYIFKILDSQSDRHIVQIFSADEKTVYATVLAIPNYRLKATGKTVITFSERPAGQPEALRAWFYPGMNWGEEFVYPKTKALELAKSTNTPILSAQADIIAETSEPVRAADEPVVLELKRMQVVAVKPTGEEIELALVVSPPPAGTLVATRLPDTASPLPLIALLGFLALAGALVLRVFGKGPQLRRSAATLLGLLLCTALSLALAPSNLMAQLAPVNLRTAGNYTILSETGITDVPPSVITGNIGASPITGAAVHVSCSEVTGTISVVDAAGPAPCSLIVPAALGQAVLDMGTAYADAAGRTIPNFTELGAGNISGMTLVPGLYKWSTGVAVNTSITLSGGPNAVWIFQIAGDLNLANGAQIILAGGAQANNIFWQVGGPTAVTLGTGTVFNGTILSAKQIIMNTGARMTGRALAQTQVTLQSTTGTSPGALVNGVPVLVAPTVTSTVPSNLATGVSISSALAATFSEAMNPATISTSTFTLKNGLTPVTGSVSYVGVTATFTPSANLISGTLYTATITTGAQDPAGVALTANYTWTFTTGTLPNLTPPTVTSTAPANGATGVALGTALAATFSETVNPLTVNATTFTLKQGVTPVLGTVSYAGVTAIFTPSGSLAASLPYTATISTGVTDLSGNALASNYVWSFTTGAAPNLTPPTVSSTVPANGATNVAISAALAATFSEAVNPLTVNTSTFLVKQGATPVAGTVTYAGVTATFTPSSALAQNLPFTATITTGVTDLSGNALAANYIWTFTTGSTPNLTAPTVSSTVPPNGATNVLVTSALAATFSEAVNPLTINTTTFTVKQGATPIPGTVTYAGVTATFTPAGSLAASLLYTATISTGVTDLSGNALASNYVWSFTTAAAPFVPIPLTVISTAPAAGAVNVPVGSAISATFSAALNPLSVNTGTFTLKQGNTAQIAGTVTYSGVTATFTPLVSLAPNSTYTAALSGGIANLSGNGLVSYFWIFTTGSAASLTPPAVISTVPANGATGVPVGNALVATFSEPVNPLTITNVTFSLKQGATPVAGTVTYAGVNATFTPTVSLAPNVTFTATVSTGVIDLSGNALAANYVWSFTTGSAPNLTPPTVISTLPSNGATFVTTTSNVVVNFSEPMNPLTINTVTFYLMQGTTQIAGIVSFSGTSATFAPVTLLSPNTLYNAVVASSVADLSGNLLGTNYLFSFTTGNSGGQSPVCLPNFAVLAGSAVIGNGTSTVTGDIGVSPGTSITGFPPGTLTGTLHPGDPVAQLAMTDLTASYANAVARSVGPVSVSGDIGGQTFTAGLYTSAGPLSITAADLSLDAKGNPNAIFIFQLSSTFTTATGRQIILLNGAQAVNVFWQVGTSATLGANSTFNGSILANQSILLNAGATVNGRLAAISGTVTLQSNVVSSPPPAVFANGTVNGATDTRIVAAGSIASVFGTNLGSALRTSSSYPLPDTLGGSSFQVGTFAAPLYMASCGQANIQIPWEVAGQTQVPVSATVGDLTSVQEPVVVAPYAPGIFAMNMSGGGQGAVEIANTSLIVAPVGPTSRPANPGEYISIFLTGLGPVSNQPATGAAAASNPFSTTSALPTVSIGGAFAQVTYSGLAPGYAGLYQINAIVPAGAPAGAAVSLVITIGGITSNTVNIAIQ